MTLFNIQLYNTSCFHGTKLLLFFFFYILLLKAILLDLGYLPIGKEKLK